MYRSQLACRLHLHPCDTAILVGYAAGRRRDKPAMDAVFAVVHRKRQSFTHIYRLGCEARSGRSDVYLEKVLAGEQIGEARRWALTAFAIEDSASDRSRSVDKDTAGLPG